MKKTFYLAIVLATFLVSCNNSQDSVSLSSGSLSQSVKSYVVSNYPDASVDTIVVSNNQAVATLSSGEELTFNLDGSFDSYSNSAKYGISTDSLVVDTDSTEINDSTDVENDSTQYGDHHYENGDYRWPGGESGDGPDSLQEHPDSMNAHYGDDRHYGNPYMKHHADDLSIDSLSTVINDYISSNYAGYTIIHASSDTLCEGPVTEVLVCDSVTEPVQLVFDANNTFLMSGLRINYSKVPTAVSSAVSTDFANYKVSERCIKYTLVDGSLEYKVFLKSNTVFTWSIYKSDGTVACDKQ